MSITKYTHSCRIRGLHDDNKTETYCADVRRVGKWWDTKSGRRFDLNGFMKYHMVHGVPGRWRMELETLERLR